MRHAKLLITTVVALSLLCFFTIPTASAQPLDGLWFRLNGQFQGYTVDPGTGGAAGRRVGGIAYLGFVWNGVDAYNYEVYTEQAPGVWSLSTSGSYMPTLEYYFPDWEWTWWGEGGLFVTFYQTAAITPARWGSGLRYRGWGEVYDGDDGLGNMLYGGVTITGRSIDPSRLPPFTVPTSLPPSPS